MQEFKVGDHVIVAEGDESYPPTGLTVGLDALVTGVYSDTHVDARGVTDDGYVLTSCVHPSALIKVDDLVTGPFAPGDRALVVSNGGRDLYHFIDIGTDVEITEGPKSLGRFDICYRVRGKSVGYSDGHQWVAAVDLEAEPTFAEPTFVEGQRVLVVGNSNGHDLTVGTDATVVTVGGWGGATAGYYLLRGIARDGYRSTQSLRACDIEAEPTSIDLFYDRAWQFEWAPYVDTIEGSRFDVAAFAGAERERALRVAFEVTGLLDVEELIAVADWLLGVPA